MPDQEVQLLQDGEEINLLDYLRVIWKYKWLIGILCSISMVGALVFSLLSPKIYESAATILIPREGGGGGLLSALGAMGIVQQVAGGSIPSLSPNRDTFLSILKSRTIAQKVVEQFNLKDYYKVPHLENAINTLQGATKVSVSKEGVIEIKVENTDPKMAADIANAYTDQLDQFMTRFGTGAASNQRRFVTEQLGKAHRELKTAEETLKQFQEQNRAVLLGDMANSLRLPGNRIPQVGLELARLTRDLKVQEAVYILLTQQLEQAKIGEAQDVPTVQVLDQAVPALHKSKPRIKQDVAITGAGSLVLGILLAFFIEYIRRQKQQMAKSK